MLTKKSGVCRRGFRIHRNKYIFKAFDQKQGDKPFQKKMIYNVCYNPN